MTGFPLVLAHAHTDLDLDVGRERHVTGFLLVLALALLHGAADERDEMRVEVTPQQRLVAGDRQERRQQLGRELRLQRLRIE